MSTTGVMLIVQPVGYQAVRTLRALCIHVIKDLIISYVQSLPASSRASLPEALFVISPFDCLPSRCVQDIIDLLAEKKQLDMTLLSILIHTHLTTLDLSILIQYSSKFFKPRFFELVASRYVLYLSQIFLPTYYCLSTPVSLFTKCQCKILTWVVDDFLKNLILNYSKFILSFVAITD